MFILYLIAEGDFFIESYKGGSSPVLLYLLIGLGVIFVGSIIGLSLLSRYRVFEFFKLCRQAKLSREEVGLLQDLLRRFNLQEKKIETLTDRRLYDVFSARIAHHYENHMFSEIDLLHEANLFGGIRKKLNLTTPSDETPIKTSRVLPLKQSVTISYIDTETQNTISFQSKILYNGEFFLGIQPPETKIAKQILTQMKQRIRIDFIRENDAEYLFDTQFVKAVNHPKTMWYVRHANRLIRTEAQKILNIPATVMFTKNEDTEEYAEFEATIQTLNNKSATFTLVDPTAALKHHLNILLNFETKEQQFAWGGMISNQIQTPDQIIYRTEFRSVPDEDNLIMLKLMRKTELSPDEEISNIKL